MKKFIKFIKRFAYAIIEALFLTLALLAVLVGGQVVAVVLAFAGIVVRMFGTIKSKASVEFLKAIDVADKKDKEAKKLEKVAVKKATQSVKANSKSVEAKKEANSFL